MILGVVGAGSRHSAVTDVYRTTPDLFLAQKGSPPEPATESWNETCH